METLNDEAHNIQETQKTIYLLAKYYQNLTPDNQNQLNQLLNHLSNPQIRTYDLEHQIINVLENNNINIMNSRFAKPELLLCARRDMTISKASRLEYIKNNTNHADKNVNIDEIITSEKYFIKPNDGASAQKVVRLRFDQNYAYFDSMDPSIHQILNKSQQTKTITKLIKTPPSTTKVKIEKYKETLNQLLETYKNEFYIEKAYNIKLIDNNTWEIRVIIQAPNFQEYQISSMFVKLSKNEFISNISTGGELVTLEEINLSNKNRQNIIQAAHECAPQITNYLRTIAPKNLIIDPYASDMSLDFVIDTTHSISHPKLIDTNFIYGQTIPDCDIQKVYKNKRTIHAQIKYFLKHCN